MKILSLETFLANAGLRNYLFIRLRTDTGLTGVGEATLEWQEKTVATLLHEWVEGRVLGRDPFDVEAVVGGMIRDQYQGGSTVMTAISGVEIALWDMIGKACGQPVYRLLGGRCHDRIPAYANGWYGGAQPRRVCRAARARRVARGYRALKFDPFGTAWKVTDAGRGRRGRRDRRGGAQGRRAGVGLMIEFHGRLAAGAGRRDDPPARAVSTPPGARSRSRPSASSCWPRSSDGAPCPIAAGERLYTLADFYRLTALRAADVVQMDLAHCGGISAGKKIAAMAEAQDLASRRTARSVRSRWRPACTST